VAAAARIYTGEELLVAAWAGPNAALLRAEHYIPTFPSSTSEGSQFVQISIHIAFLFTFISNNLQSVRMEK
jgi:hypothetical protein